MFTEIQLFQSPGHISIRFFVFWGWMKSEVYKRRVNTRDELHADILDAAVRIKKVKIKSDKKQAVFAHELQSAPRLTVRFWNCNKLSFLWTNLSFKY